MEGFRDFIERLTNLILIFKDHSGCYMENGEDSENRRTIRGFCSHSGERK